MFLTILWCTKVSPIDRAMRSGLYIQELHQGYRGMIRLLGVYSDFMLEWRMMGVHGCMEGMFLF